MTTPHEIVELRLQPTVERFEVEFVGRVTRDISGRGLRYEFAASPVACTILARPDHGAPFRHGLGYVDTAGNVDLHPIAALCDGDYLYRVGRSITPTLEERITRLEKLLGLVADELAVAGDAEEVGRGDLARQMRATAITSIQAAWSALTGEQRIELLTTCCSSCGALDPTCPCGDDS